MFLDLCTVENIRDLGGIKTKDDRIIKSKRLLRSSTLHQLSQEEFNKLKTEYNLKTVLDFRSTKSAKNKLDAIDNSVCYEHIYVLDYLEDHGYTEDITVSPDEFFINIYRMLALSDRAIKAYRLFFDRLMNQKDGTILWHCTSGKDRTGIATVLLLSALGCSKETIYEEHFLTNQITTPLLDQKMLEIDKDDEDKINYYEAYYIAKKKYIDEYYKAIENKYGSIDKYLEYAIRLSSESINELKTRYLK